MFSVTKVPTVATCQKSTPGKRHRLADKLHLVDEREAAIVGDPIEHRLRFRLWQYRVLCATWALAGCFVYLGTGKPATCIVIGWALRPTAASSPIRQMTCWIITMRTALLITSSRPRKQSVVMPSLQHVIGNDPRAWGRSLLEAAHANAQLWIDNKKILRELQGQAAPSRVGQSPMGANTRPGGGKSAGGNQSGFIQVFPAVPTEAGVRQQRAAPAGQGYQCPQRYEQGRQGRHAHQNVHGHQGGSPDLQTFQ